MDWAAQRQKLLSQNVVNANSLDYTPQDLKKLDFRRELRKAVPANVMRIDPNHAKDTLPTRDAFRNREVRRNFEAITGWQPSHSRRTDAKGWRYAWPIQHGHHPNAVTYEDAQNGTRQRRRLETANDNGQS